MALKFVVLTDAGKLLNWQSSCLQILLESGHGEVVLLVENTGTQARPSGPVQKYLSYPWSKLLWRLFDRFRKPAAARDTGYGATFDGVPVLRCQPVKKGRWSQYFRAEDLQVIREYQPDVILRFGFGIIKGEILEVARYGVCSYHHSDPKKYRGGPPFFWEIMRHDRVTGAILQRLNEKIDSGIVLQSGQFRTSLHSFRETADKVLYGAAGFVRDVAADIALGREERLQQPPLQNAHLPVRKVPGNLRFLVFQLRLLYHRIGLHLHELFRADVWQVGLAPGSPESLLQKGLAEPIRWVPFREKGQFIADPFPLPGSDRYLLCEKYDFREGKGHIARVDSHTGQTEKQLSGPSHFSFPHVFRQGKYWYMLPENNVENQLVLYRFHPDEKQWQPAQVLLEGERIIDPILYQHHQRWWLFATKSGLYSNSQLWIYGADSLDGPFRPHRMQPAKTDITSARPAGPLFTAQGQLYRPAMNCTETYGGSLAINQITQLSQDFFEETTVKRYYPQKHWPWNRGLHHLSFVENQVVIDAKKFGFHPHHFWNGLKSRLGK